MRKLPVPKRLLMALIASSCLSFVLGEDAFGNTFLCHLAHSGIPSLSEFQANPSWDGSRPFPREGHISLVNEADPYKAQMSFEFKLLSTLPKEALDLVKNLKKEAHHLTDREREMGGVLVEYEDGSKRSLTFTSNHLEKIERATELKAYKDNLIFSRNKKVKRVLHIHTHSDPRSPLLSQMNYIGPTIDDFGVYTDLRQKLRAAYGNDTILEGLVIPSCQNCDDVGFYVHTSDLDGFHFDLIK